MEMDGLFGCMFILACRFQVMSLDLCFLNRVVVCYVHGLLILIPNAVKYVRINKSVFQCTYLVAGTVLYVYFLLHETLQTVPYVFNGG